MTLEQLISELQEIKSELNLNAHPWTKYTEVELIHNDNYYVVEDIEIIRVANCGCVSGILINIKEANDG